jgi:DNA-binding winged helix-turn-helix (wHTH) protein
MEGMTMIVFRGQDVPYTLDRRNLLLFRDKERILLQPQEWKLLNYFVANPGRLISKQELLDELWTGQQTVGETSLSRAVANLRNKLGDQAKRPLFIETVQKFGFRFVAPIEEIDEDPTDEAGTATAQRPPATQVQEPFHEQAHASGEIATYYVNHLDRWPYESTTTHGSEPVDQPIAIATNLQTGTTYRCVGSRASQYIDWGLLGHNINNGEREDASGNGLLSTKTILPAELWIQVEYVLFHANTAPADLTIAPFRDHLMVHGCTKPSPQGIVQPVSVRIGYNNDPHFQWFQLGEAPTAEQTYVFVSSISDIPYINQHTIPNATAFQFVHASIIDLRRYTKPITYRELFKRFDDLNAWYHNCRTTAEPRETSPR